MRPTALQNAATADPAMAAFTCCVFGRLRGLEQGQLAAGVVWAAEVPGADARAAAAKQ
jgi:hypothetical protein